jgi:hypothetical protein
MAHQLGEHIERDPGVGMALGVGVAVGVGRDRGRVVGAAVRAPQRCRQRHKPSAVGPPDHVPAHRPQAAGRGIVAGQQDKLGHSAVGEPFPGCLLLGDDQLGSGSGDRQPAAGSVVLVVVVDQHIVVVVVAAQAVPRQLQDLRGSPSGVDQQLDRDRQCSRGAGA